MSRGEVVAVDDDGDEVREGDWITFSFGIPGVRVEAPIIERRGKLIALTPEHKPQECALRSLRRHVGHFWKLDRPNLFREQSEPPPLNPQSKREGTD